MVPGAIVGTLVFSVFFATFLDVALQQKVRVMRKAMFMDAMDRVVVRPLDLSVCCVLVHDVVVAAQR